MRTRLYTLAGAFGVIATFDSESLTDVRVKVAKHLQGSGYSNLREVDDNEGGLRFVADPPTGRKGRNVAQLDY